MAEGSGICILEEYEHARQRNAPIYGEFIGYGQTNDAACCALHHPMASNTPEPYAWRCRKVSYQPENIAYFNLDGRALPAADQGEVSALQLNDLAHVPVSVPRTTIGHSYAAAGAIDTITALLALKHGMIPPTINCEQLDPRYELDMVRDEVRVMQARNTVSEYEECPAVLVGGRGLGGANVVLALKKLG